MSDSAGLPKRTLLQMICTRTHGLKKSMIMTPRYVVDDAEELIKQNVFSTAEERAIVERFKAAALEFDLANAQMFSLGKKYGGDDL